MNKTIKFKSLIPMFWFEEQLYRNNYKYWDKKKSG